MCMRLVFKHIIIVLDRTTSLIPSSVPCKKDVVLVGGCMPFVGLISPEFITQIIFQHC